MNIYLEIDITIELPQESGVYLVRYKDDTPGIKCRSIFFKSDIGEFSLKNGRKNVKLISWFKRIEVTESIFNELNSKL